MRPEYVQSLQALLYGLYAVAGCVAGAVLIGWALISYLGQPSDEVSDNA